MTRRKSSAVMIEQAEVMCIIMEEITGSTRPEGMTPQEALKAAQIVGDPEAAGAFMGSVARASTRIIEYMIAEVVANVPGATGGILNQPTETRQ